MNANELKQLVLETLDDYKAKDVTEIDVNDLTNVTDFMVICSSTSKRHAQTLSEQLVINAKKNGIKPLGIEGEDDGEWILVDLVDVVVHIMQPKAREFYSLEKLWSKAEDSRTKNED